MKPRIEPDRQRNPELPLAVNETPDGAEGRPPLLPVRYPDPDLFICDVLDAIPKDDMASMEHPRSEEHTSELQSLMRNSYAVFCLKKKTKKPISLQQKNRP